MKNYYLILPRKYCCTCTYCRNWIWVWDWTSRATASSTAWL